MTQLLVKLRKLAQMDVHTILEHIRHFKISQHLILSAVEKFYHFSLILSIVILLSAFIEFIWPTSEPASTTVSSFEYNYTQPAQAKARSLGGFGSNATEGKDPLWLELRTYLDFSGVNARPDNASGPIAHFRWLNSGQEIKAVVNQTLYFASNNSHWSRVDKSRSFQLAVKVLKVAMVEQGMQAELEILHPKEDGSLQSIETVTLLREVDKKKTDTAALQGIIRAGCRWWGPDLFLLNHSGPESRELAMMQRLELGPINRTQVLYVGPGYGIVQHGQEFAVYPFGSSTQGQVMWVVEEVKSDKLVLTAWSAKGDQTQAVAIAKQQEAWNPKALESQIQLAGLRSKDQLLVQIKQERWNLKVLDWLLHTSKGWEKFRNPQQVDAYVSGQVKGELLILRGLKQDSTGAWVALFRIYSPARSQIYEFELQAGSLSGPAPSPEGPTIEQIRDPNSLFVPIPNREQEMPKWPADEDRAWQPTIEISPEKMLEILRNLNEIPVESFVDSESDKEKTSTSNSNLRAKGKRLDR